jgi:hypothetical protein
MPGGAASFENGEWVRLDLDGQPVLPLFRINNVKGKEDATHAR